jgi:hypothetical protein
VVRLSAHLRAIRDQLRNRIVRRIGLIDVGAFRKGEVSLAPGVRKPRPAPLSSIRANALNRLMSNTERSAALAIRGTAVSGSSA